MSRIAMPRVVLYANAAIYVVTGILFLLFPGKLADAIDIGLHSADALTDVRAIYGGMAIGIGVWLTLHGLRNRIADGLEGALLLAVGFVIARVIGFTLDGEHSAFLCRIAVIEAAGLVLNAAALLRLRGENATGRPSP